MGQREQETLLAEANRVMERRRAEHFDPETVSRMKLDLSCLCHAEDGCLDLDTLLTQRRRLRLLARAKRHGELERLEPEAWARCEVLLELAPAYQHGVNCVLSLHGLFYGDEGGMERMEPNRSRAELRQTLKNCLKELDEKMEKENCRASDESREQPVFRDPFDLNNDGKVDPEEEFLSFMMMERNLQDAEEDREERFDDGENDLI